MSKFNRGKARGYARTVYGKLTIDPLTTSLTRIGKQSVFGPRKGSTPPGNHSNQTKNAGR